MHRPVEMLRGIDSGVLGKEGINKQKGEKPHHLLAWAGPLHLRTGAEGRHHPDGTSDPTNWSLLLQSHIGGQSQPLGIQVTCYNSSGSV